MAPRSQRPRASRGEKHGWLGFGAYQEIHERTLERHPFVLEDRTRFERIDDENAISYRLEGDILCGGGILIEVSKLYDVQVVRGIEQIRGARYRYTARLPGRGNILRYDNLHESAPDEFHRHVYDLNRWQEASRETLERERMPTLGEVVEEVMRLAADAGLLDSS